MKLTKPLNPGAMIGILGGGQLARMLALAAAELGFHCHIYAPEGDSPAFQVAAAHTLADYDDFEQLTAFANAVDVITYEFENVPAETSAYLGQRKPLAPNAKALEISQDRGLEKDFIASIGIPVAPYALVADEQGLQRAIDQLGLPAILKTRRFGYDGKGQVKIGGDMSAAQAQAVLSGAPAILEAFVPFDYEVSLLIARGWEGETALYDIPLNHHENHILRTSTVPSPLSPDLGQEASAIAQRIVHALDYVGVMGIELFVQGDHLMVNEIAPRVHNSGHWTQDACLTSQFEQHIRAITGWPLGSTTRHSDVVMHNILGTEMADWQELATRPNSCLHLYGKKEMRQSRKMGHINLLTPRQG